MLYRESIKGPPQLTSAEADDLKYGQVLFVLLSRRDESDKPLMWYVYRITPTLYRYARRARTDEAAYDRITTLGGTVMAGKGGALVMKFKTELPALDWLYKQEQGGARYVRVRLKPPSPRKIDKPMSSRTYKHMLDDAGAAYEDATPWQREQAAKRASSKR